MKWETHTIAAVGSTRPPYEQMRAEGKVKSDYEHMFPDLRTQFILSIDNGWLDDAINPDDRTYRDDEGREHIHTIWNLESAAQQWAALVSLRPEILSSTVIERPDL